MNKPLLVFLVAAVAVIGGTIAYRVLDTPETVEQRPQAAATEVAQSTKERQGAFTRRDNVHAGTGQAVVYKGPNGAVLKFENFTVTDGPDLHVYLTKNSNVTSDYKEGEFVSLGKLQKVSGEQTYTLPANHADYEGVLIWCRAFSTPFTAALLQ